jgi:hypothetical protein
VTFSYFENIPLVIAFSTIDSISELKMLSNVEPMYIYRSTLVLLENSSFRDNGRLSALNGGAIFNRESNTTIINSIFERNMAYEGGAIKVD